MLPFIEALPTRRNPRGDFGEEIRGTLIPNDALPQANEETDNRRRRARASGNLDGSSSRKLKRVRGFGAPFFF